MSWEDIIKEEKDLSKVLDALEKEIKKERMKPDTYGPLARDEYYITKLDSIIDKVLELALYLERKYDEDKERPPKVYGPPQAEA